MPAIASSIAHSSDSEIQLNSSNARNALKQVEPP